MSVIIVFVLYVATALAAAPEPPGLKIEGIRSTEAVFAGTLNPLATEPQPPGIYHFVYKVGPKCEGGTETTGGLALGVAPEPLPGEPVSSLTPASEYTVCLIEQAIGGTATVTAHFETTLPPETPKTSSPAKSIMATSAVVEGTLNPTKEAKDGWYFTYSAPGGSSCAEGPATAPGVEELVKAKKEKTTLTGLQPHSKYVFCLVASNNAEPPETAQSTNEVSFETGSLAAAVIGESASVKATEVHLEATVNPENEATECHFQYGTSSVSEHEAECEQGSALSGGEQGVGANVTGLPPNTTYVYRVIVRNATGKQEGEEEHFTTAIAPETPTGLKAEPIAPTTAMLHGVLNPGHVGNPGSYEFLYLQSATQCEGGETSGGGSLGDAAEAVETKIENLLPNSSYTFCLRDRNDAGEETTSPPVTFTTAVAPLTIESESATVPTATEARLEAKINDGNSDASYHFEIGPEAGSYDIDVPATDGHVAGSLEAREVAAVVTGLTSSTTYHYRLVASNALAMGRVDGEDQTFTTLPATGTESPSECPNEARRAEQPSARTLPDCRAYEMVSPGDSNGQDATDSTVSAVPRAAVSGEAIAYSSAGSFAGPSGSNLENEFVSRRGSDGWTTQNISPQSEPYSGEEGEDPYAASMFTPELTEGVVASNLSLGEGAPKDGELEQDLYLTNFATGSDRYIGEGGNATDIYPMGASTDLSRVVFGEQGEVSEWADGTITPVGVANEKGALMSADVGGAARANQYPYRTRKDVWRAVSSDGSRVFFTSPGFEGTSVGNFPLKDQQLYARVNVGQQQSPLASTEAVGTGTTMAGSHTVTSLIAAAGLLGKEVGAGATELPYVDTTVGEFHVGQPLSGPSFEQGTTITNVSGETLTLSHVTIAGLEPGTLIVSEGPTPFAIGQRISGNGVPAGTTITAEAAGTLTLSAPAASSGTGVELRAGGECTDPMDACTIDVSASQRVLENPAGPQPARYWGASTGADGGPEKVFFTSTAELTEDAYTGPKGNAEDLYEYDLEDGRLADLTPDDEEATDGAAVQGVAQISEDGAYVYFVAKGVLAHGPNTEGREPVAGQPNLYVTHDRGEPVFLATLAEGDQSDWDNAAGGEDPQIEASPAITTAVTNANGDRLAFISERPLPTAAYPAGYDNRQAQNGQCEGPIQETKRHGTGNCREVYLYDAAYADLVCASCNPSGARPTGPSGLRQGAYDFAQYGPRNLTASGTLFFDSSDALTAGATEGRENVYEYENGHVYPISNVAGPADSFFLDASGKPGEEGRDVFFATADDLIPQDTSGNIVVYDAREDGGFPVPASVVSCETAESVSCRPPASPQPGVYGPGGTATFSGPGDLMPTLSSQPKHKTAAQERAEKLAKALKACTKDKKKSTRAECQKQARQKYGAKKSAKKASNKQGAK